MKNSIGILDYGCGNIKSVQNAVSVCGYDVKLIHTTKDIKQIDRIILPGVGAFDHAARLLNNNELSKTLISWVQDQNHKLLGICVGMQLLCRGSEESIDDLEGLGLIEADVRKLPQSTNERLPHIGWREVEFCVNGYEPYTGDYYFIHSYGVFCDHEAQRLAKTQYGEIEFASAVTNSQNVYGYQFHPEKSQKKGLSLIKAFCEL